MQYDVKFKWWFVPALAGIFAATLFTGRLDWLDSVEKKKRRERLAEQINRDNAIIVEHMAEKGETAWEYFTDNFRVSGTSNDFAEWHKYFKELNPEYDGKLEKHEIYKVPVLKQLKQGKSYTHQDQEISYDEDFENIKDDTPNDSLVEAKNLREAEVVKHKAEENETPWSYFYNFYLIDEYHNNFDSWMQYFQKINPGYNGKLEKGRIYKVPIAPEVRKYQEPIYQGDIKKYDKLLFEDSDGSGRN